MRPPSFLIVGAVYGFFAVALGAFGAHGLKSRVAEAALGWWQTGVHYHGLHALALLAVGLLALHLPDSRLLRGAGWAFTVGVALFAGSLYLLTLGAPRWMGSVTPVGGVLLLIGWGLLAAAATQTKKTRENT